VLVEPEMVVEKGEIAKIVMVDCIFWLFDEPTFLTTQNLIFNGISHWKKLCQMILGNRKFLLKYSPIDKKMFVYLVKLRIRLHSPFVSSPRTLHFTSVIFLRNIVKNLGGFNTKTIDYNFKIAGGGELSRD
jgi:hypothetical protein